MAPSLLALRLPFWLFAAQSRLVCMMAVITLVASAPVAKDAGFQLGQHIHSIVPMTDWQTRLALLASSERIVQESGNTDWMCGMENIPEKHNQVVEACQGGALSGTSTCRPPPLLWPLHVH